MNAQAALWLSPAPLILASNSAARRALLLASGLNVIVKAAHLDERQIEEPLVAAKAAPEMVAQALARAKAEKVSLSEPGCLVIGADQILAMDGVIFHRALTLEAAAVQLSILSARAHVLHSAVSVCRDGVELFATVSKARMLMRPLTPQFIATYLACVASVALESVGCYQIEGMGSQLFQAIDGDHSTILGLPLLPLLAFLRSEGSLAS